ncbi:hypothetical protein GGR50DRAFT_643085 [Xylaria sp. CBS 124048]|nr:hypothetical protein GGR50DRAFT_643085 [Xylaria sp. CBS 124048]
MNRNGSVLSGRRSQAIGDRRQAGRQAQSSWGNSTIHKQPLHWRTGQGDRRSDRGSDGGGQGNQGWRNTSNENVSLKKPENDESELLYAEEIQKHFWGSQAGPLERDALQASKDCPDQLSHVLLLAGAFPSWRNGHTVRTRSNLGLLPEYRAKKAERRDWVDEKNEKNEKNNCSKALGHKDNEAQGASISGPDVSPTSGGRPKLSEFRESLDTFRSTDLCKEEGVQVITNSRKEEEKAASDSTSSKMSDNRAKPENIRLIPAREFYSKPEPTFPSIAPIIYTPSTSRPIAIFEEKWSPYSSTATQYAFRGWFKISRVTLLAPRSAELADVLCKDRRGFIIPIRQRAVNSEWAVVKFVPMSEDNGAPPPLVIEKLRPLPAGSGVSMY